MPDLSRSVAVILGTVLIAATAPAQAVYRLVGTVSASDGHVVSGAEVSIVERDTAVRVTRSDSAGRFTFEGLTTPALTLRVRHFGYEPQLLSVHVTKSRSYGEHLRHPRAKRRESGSSPRRRLSQARATESSADRIQRATRDE